MGLFRRKPLTGRYDGPVAFDGQSHYAVVKTPRGDELDLSRRLKAEGEEFHYAEDGYPHHNDLHGTNVTELDVGGEDEAHA